jgi:hypothetical protein
MTQLKVEELRVVKFGLIWIGIISSGGPNYEIELQIK